MVRRSMKHRYTKRGYIKRGYIKRGYMNRQNKKNKTKRKMRGGSGRVWDKEAQQKNAKFRARKWREGRKRTQRKKKARQPASRSRSRTRSRSRNYTPHPLSFNILNKFFEKEAGWFGRISYKLNMPDNKINLISAHGISIPNQFFVIPEGLTLYLSIPGGQPHRSFMMRGGQSKASWDEYVARTYIREYSGGSLIQDYDISFSPFYRSSKKYTERGLLMYDAPRITAKNANEANKKLIEFLSRRMMKYRRDKRIEREGEEKHLEEYESVYFQNNIDDIISKDELIKSAIGSKYIFLSEILGRIATARKSNKSISGEWFGTFCRSGDFIDIDKFNKCSEPGLPQLPTDFFEGNFHYEGVRSELTKQQSLASNNPTINFKQILDEVYNKKQELGVGQMAVLDVALIKLIKQQVENNQNISFEDVCLVFQMKQKLIEQSQ